MEYKQAKEIAIKLLRKLEPFCEKINFAGDIAKKKQEIESIHIYCIPKVDDRQKRYQNFHMAVQSIGVFVDGDVLKSWVKIHLPESINLVIFMPDEKIYFYRLVSHEMPKSFINKIDAAKTDKDFYSKPTEWDFFNSIGLTWIPIIERV